MPNGGHARGVGGPRRWRGPPVATGSARARARAWLRAWLRALEALSPALLWSAPRATGWKRPSPGPCFPPSGTLARPRRERLPPCRRRRRRSRTRAQGPDGHRVGRLRLGRGFSDILARSRRVCCGSHTIQPALKAAAAGSTACTAASSATATLGAPRWALPTRQTPLDQVLLSSSCCFSPPSRESDHMLSHAATHTCTTWPVLLLAA